MTKQLYTLVAQTKATMEIRHSSWDSTRIAFPQALFHDNASSFRLSVCSSPTSHRLTCLLGFCLTDLGAWWAFSQSRGRRLEMLSLRLALRPQNKAFLSRKGEIPNEAPWPCKTTVMCSAFQRSSFPLFNARSVNWTEVPIHAAQIL